MATPGIDSERTMDRVFAALERDPDTDIEASLAGALDADAGFRKLLREFSERASDAASFMATPGGPGLSLAVDALLIEGAEQLHDGAIAALAGCGRSLWGPMSSLMVRDLSASALSAVLLMRANANLSKALAELTLAAASAGTSAATAEATDKEKRAHHVVVRCELAVPPQPCPDGRTIRMARHDDDLSDGVTPLPVMVPGERVTLRLVVHPDNDPACGPVYTAACGRKLVAAIASAARLDAVDIEHGFPDQNDDNNTDFLAAIDTRAVMPSHGPDIRGTPGRRHRARWWPLGAASVDPIAFGQFGESLNAHGSMCRHCWNSILDAESRVVDLIVLVGAISGRSALPLKDSVYFREDDDAADDDTANRAGWPNDSSYAGIDITSRKMRRAMQDAVSGAMRRSAHLFLRHLVCRSTRAHRNLDMFHQGGLLKEACWKAVAMHMDAASSRALLREVLGAKDVAPEIQQRESTWP